MEPPCLRWCWFDVTSRLAAGFTQPQMEKGLMEPLRPAGISLPSSVTLKKKNLRKNKPTRPSYKLIWRLKLKRCNKSSSCSIWELRAIWTGGFFKSLRWASFRVFTSARSVWLCRNFFSFLKCRAKRFFRQRKKNLEIGTTWLSRQDCLCRKLWQSVLKIGKINGKYCYENSYKPDKICFFLIRCTSSNVDVEPRCYSLFLKKQHCVVPQGQIRH